MRYLFEEYAIDTDRRELHRGADVVSVAPQVFDLLGGAGITTEYCPIRHALNLESVITYEGTETVHQLVVGRELTGINAF